MRWIAYNGGDDDEEVDPDDMDSGDEDGDDEGY
jgi:hypothetical protein